MLHTILQWIQPKEFRIHGYSVHHDVSDEILKLHDALSSISLRSNKNGGEKEIGKEWLQTLTAGCTGLWRVRKNMVHFETDRSLEEMRTMDGMQRAYRHLVSVWDTLLQSGIKIQDHTGEIIPEGGIYGLRTVAREPSPGLTRERVIDTIKPSIYFNGKMIQMGEVIVGTPPPAVDKNSGGAL